MEDHDHVGMLEEAGGSWLYLEMTYIGIVSFKANRHEGIGGHTLTMADRGCLCVYLLVRTGLIFSFRSTPYKFRYAYLYTADRLEP